MVGIHFRDIEVIEVTPIFVHLALKVIYLIANIEKNGRRRKCKGSLIIKLLLQRCGCRNVII